MGRQLGGTWSAQAGVLGRPWDGTGKTAVNAVLLAHEAVLRLSKPGGQRVALVDANGHTRSANEGA